MKKITTGQRLRQIMSDRNLKQVDILRKTKPFQGKYDIKLSRSALSQYVNDVQSPDKDRLYLLSKTLDVSEPWLMGFNVSMERIEDIGTDNKDEEMLIIYRKLTDNRKDRVIDYARKQLKTQKEKINEIAVPFTTKNTTYEFPFYGAVSAGTGEWMYDEINETITLNHEPPVNADFALKVNGDSMQPLFENGQLIFVDVVEDPAQVYSNQIVIADLNGEAFVKKIVFERSGCRLVSLNKKYEDKMVTENDAFYVRGIVVL